MSTSTDRFADEVKAAVKALLLRDYPIGIAQLGDLTCDFQEHTIGEDGGIDRVRGERWITVRDGHTGDNKYLHKIQEVAENIVHQLKTESKVLAGRSRPWRRYGVEDR
jgi:hypothetical protein